MAHARARAPGRRRQRVCHVLQESRHAQKGLGSYIAGPSLAILEKYLNQSLTKPFIPYEAALKDYVAADEAATRYKNLAAYYGQYKHFWVGNGPFFLYSVKPTEKIITLRKFAGFADPTDKWARFASRSSPRSRLPDPAASRLVRRQNSR